MATSKTRRRFRGSLAPVVSALIALAVGLAVGTACSYSPTGPGLIYMNVKSPNHAYAGESREKEGRSCQRVFLALFAWGDASIESAKRDGDISQVTTVDFETTNFLGFGRFCTVIYGS